MDEAQTIRALLDRGRDAATLLGPAVRPEVDALIAAVQRVFLESLDDLSRDELRRSVSALVELVARRDARAMPFAALGRAALAQLHGARETQALLAEFDAKLSMFGL